MIEGGEDPRFIARRMIVLASEDIGNADPQALPIAVAAAHAVEHVGFPEAEFALAQAAIYLSLAPKSDAVKRAIGEVRGHIREHGHQAPAGAAALGRLPGGAQARPRQGLRLPARPPRPRQRPGAPARGPRGPALLLPGRGRAGGARPARRDPQGARARLVEGACTAAALVARPRRGAGSLPAPHGDGDPRRARRARRRAGGQRRPAAHGGGARRAAAVGRRAARPRRRRPARAARPPARAHPRAARRAPLGARVGARSASVGVRGGTRLAVGRAGARDRPPRCWPATPWCSPRRSRGGCAPRSSAAASRPS